LRPALGKNLRSYLGKNKKAYSKKDWVHGLSIRAPTSKDKALSSNPNTSKGKKI
jgi:hypothetical protein